MNLLKAKLMAGAGIALVVALNLAFWGVLAFGVYWTVCKFSVEC